MRNFSKVSTHVFSSCSINGGEYETELATVLVIEELACAFETPLPRVKDAFTALLNFGEEAYTQLTPSEERCVADFVAFLRGRSNTETSAFQYSNLNTGATVTVVHFVA